MHQPQLALSFDCHTMLANPDVGNFSIWRPSRLVQEARRDLFRNLVLKPAMPGYCHPGLDHHWIAVGDQNFVKSVAVETKNRRRFTFLAGISI